MKIAIVSNFNFHYECIGFLCELLREHSVTIYFNGDRYGYIDYFKTIFPNITSQHAVQVNPTIPSQFDLVIKLSSNDTILTDKRVVSLLHLEDSKELFGRP